MAAVVVALQSSNGRATARATTATAATRPSKARLRPAVSSCVEVGGRGKQAAVVLDPGPALFVYPILTIPNVINLVGLTKSCS